ISSRFSRGMSTPAIRAMALPLPLLVPLAGRADDHDPPVAADDLALLAHRLDARTDFHIAFLLWASLLVAIGNAPTLQVVGRDLDLDSVAREDADAVHSHLSGAVGQ